MSGIESEYNDEAPLHESYHSSKQKSFFGARGCLLLCLVALLGFFAVSVVMLGSAISIIATNSNFRGPKPKNVIMMVPDGFGPAAVTLGRECLKHYNNKTQYYLDDIFSGTSQTYSSNSLVTDSAAGATAFSCGLKTKNGRVAVQDDGKPCRTVLEAAMSKGMKTGVVVTSRVTHATPAAFTAHVPDRDMESEIATQQLNQSLSVLFGGGRCYYQPKEDQSSCRNDKKDLLNKAIEEQEYKYFSKASDLSDIQKKLNDDDLPKNERREILDSKYLGLFSEDHMSFEIDRDPKKQPSLKEMTTFALDILKDSSKGFFLLVEGSRIDHAGHINDPSTMSHEIFAYNEAVGKILDFADDDQNTMVISVADHETGGLSLGHIHEYVYYPEVLLRVKASAAKMAEQIDQGESPKDVVQSEADITLSNSQIESIGNTTSFYELKTKLGHIISDKARIGWSTTGHTGVDVNIYSSGPGSDIIDGNRQNTDIGKAITEMLGLDDMDFNGDIND
eukprot:gb/GECH01003654.1/.p1 GENE.gb/GECH01003654.1/~~gb/GECH01003654.1/.p1  ORF type:complete len:505 (+),score=135.67 gb/GECH01003654.1/:1-1515(+)